MQGNPCHEIGMLVAQQVGCDFLVNAAITHARELAGVFAGDLVEAHEAGCEQVGAWTSAAVTQPFDLVVTSAGGYPLDESYYQTVKGMVTLPAPHEGSQLLMCAEIEVGSPEFTALMQLYGDDYEAFLRDIAASGRTEKDQWQFQMQTRVLARVGRARLLLANDGLPLETQRGLGVTPVAGEGDAVARAQRHLDAFVQQRPDARVAVIPEGPRCCGAGVARLPAVAVLFEVLLQVARAVGVAVERRRLVGEEARIVGALELRDRSWRSFGTSFRARDPGRGSSPDPGRCGCWRLDGRALATQRVVAHVLDLAVGGDPRLVGPLSQSENRFIGWVAPSGTPAGHRSGSG